MPEIADTKSHLLHLSLCTIGIFCFFLIYGITQEKLMTKLYDGVLFTDTAFLVLINRLVSIAFASFFLWKNKEKFSPAAPPQNYAFVSLSNFMSTFCQYEALKYVTFPTQTLGKCGKMIPVLLIGTFIQKKSYTYKEYLIAFTVMAGCTIFLTTGDISSKRSSKSSYDTPFGLILILMYLLCDGFTSTTQERLFKQYKTSTYNQMLHVNIYSAILSFMALLFPLGSSSRLFSSLQFAVEHPEMLFDAILLSLCSSFGQLVIYYTIKEFGALVYSTIMTTRQFFSVLLSAVLFLHPITGSQWLGAVFVFGALWIKTLLSSYEKNKKKYDIARQSDEMENGAILMEPVNRRQ